MGLFQNFKVCLTKFVNLFKQTEKIPDIFCIHTKQMEGMTSSRNWSVTFFVDFYFEGLKLHIVEWFSHCKVSEDSV